MITKILQMRSTPLKLSIQTQNAKQSIQSNHQVLNISTEKPKLEMTTTKSRLEIDQSACRSDVGLKPNGELIEDNAIYAKQMLIQGIGRIVEQGNDLAAIERPDPLPDHFKYNAFGQFIKEWNYDYLPKSRPKISFTPSKINYQFQRGKVINHTVPQKPQIDYQAGKVNINVAQYNKLDISIVDMKG